MSNLKLITTEHFENLKCDFYRNMNDDILLTREQIGNALEYVNPDAALSMIHKRHKDRLDSLSVLNRLISADGKEYETTLYTQKGIMEICRWSHKPKANQFMDWAWDIIERYHSRTLESKLDNLKPITDALTTLTKSLTTLTNNMTTMHQDLQELKQSQRNRYLLDKRYPSAWYKKMLPKYKLLQEYFDCSRSELYSSIYKELEDTYDIDINQIHEDYCYENHLLKDECYPMDAIEHDMKLRDALTLLVDSNLVKYGIQTAEQIRNFKRSTLFDREPKSFLTGDN